MFCFFNFKNVCQVSLTPSPTAPPAFSFSPPQEKGQKKEGITSSALLNDIEVFTVPLYAVILGGG